MPAGPREENPKVSITFLYIEGTNPVFVFADPKEATKFAHEFRGGHFHTAEIYGDPQHVFLPKPHGLESVRASSTGVLGYIFHYPDQAKHWIDRVNATSLGEIGWQVKDGSAEHERTIFVGIDREVNTEIHAPAKQ